MGEGEGEKEDKNKNKEGYTSPCEITPSTQYL